MTSRDFCYWLQGFFELNEEPAAELSAKQADMIKRHLELVFKHEIDPSMGGAAHQQELNEAHTPQTPADAPKPAWKRPPPMPGDGRIRC